MFVLKVISQFIIKFEYATQLNFMEAPLMAFNWYDHKRNSTNISRCLTKVLKFQVLKFLPLIHIDRNYYILRQYSHR